MKIRMSLPHRLLSPNARCHWAAKSARVKAARTTAKLLALAETGPAEPWRNAVVEYRFYWPDKRRRDRDNAIASCKAHLDGLVDAGVVRDDSAVTFKPVVFAVDKEDPRLEIVIEEAA